MQGEELATGEADRRDGGKWEMGGVRAQQGPSPRVGPGGPGWHSDVTVSDVGL